MATKKIHIHYYALLREQRGCGDEIIITESADAGELYDSLMLKYRFTIGRDLVRPAINQTLCDWSTLLIDGDDLVLIPPVAGG